MALLERLGAVLGPLRAVFGTVDASIGGGDFNGLLGPVFGFILAPQNDPKTDWAFHMPPSAVVDLVPAYLLQDI